MSFFGLGRRKWAVRLLAEAGISARSDVGTELVEIILQGAKQFDEVARGVGNRLSDLDVCLMSVGTAIRNQTATERLREVGGLDDQGLKELLYNVLVAAKYVCETQGVSAGVAKFIYVGEEE